LTIVISRGLDADLSHGRRVSSKCATKTEAQSASGGAFRIMKGLVDAAIGNQGDVFEFLAQQQREEQGLAGIRQIFVGSGSARDGKLDLRVERNRDPVAFAGVEVEFEAKLAGPDADFERIAVLLGARQRKFEFHLRRKLMTKEFGQDSIIGVDE